MSKEARAIVFEQPGVIRLRRVGLAEPAAGECVVDIEWSGISTGTERLLWDGRMPPFPGLAYPLVPGYESVGRVRAVSPGVELAPGQRVFVPGSRGFTDVSGLFGGASEQLVVAADRLVPLGEDFGEEATLLALAATAAHVLARRGFDNLPDLVVGHGVLGRLIARLIVALGRTDLVVWERNAGRADGAEGYAVIDPATDTRTDYRLICDVSGDAGLLDSLVARLAPGGGIVLAGFYNEPVKFAFAPAFMREIDIAVAAEWQPRDLQTVLGMVRDESLSLQGLISHRASPADAASCYPIAFEDSDCLKMVLDWSSL